MAKRGRAGPALATSAIGSFVAGTIATIGLTFLSPLVVELGLKFGPPEYFALMVLAFTTVSAVLGESTLRGLASLFLGPRHRPRRHRQPDRPGALRLRRAAAARRHRGGRVAVGLFAVGETLYFASKLNQVKETLEKITGSIWMKAGDWKRSFRPVDPRHADRLPVRHHPGGRRRDSHVPLLRDREEALQAPRGVRQGRDRGRGRARRPPTTRRRPARWCRCSRWACRPRRPRRSCSPRSSSTACSPGRCCSSRNRAGVGPHRELLHRQRDAAGAQPAARRPVGEAARDPAPQLYAGILVFATMGVYGMRQSPFDLPRSTPSAWSASSCAATAFRPRPR